MTKDGSTLNFEHKRKSLIEYMKVKMDDGDWHGVSDAANDLRVLEAYNTAPKNPRPETQVNEVKEWDNLAKQTIRIIDKMRPRL